MIINQEYLNGRLIVSYIDDKGNLKMKNYPWANPTQWAVCSNTDPQKSDFYRTWDNKPVKLVSCRFPNRYSIADFLNKLPQQEKDEIFAYHEPKMFFCDIEVEITDGFPEAHIAENKITAICLVHGDTVLLMGIKKLEHDSWVDKLTKDINNYFKKYETKYKVKWVYYESEKEMIEDFFNELVPKMPVLTGWNFVNYDWVYFVTRARKLGINPNVASPTGKLIKPWKKNQNNEKPTYEELPKHRLVFDYMDIFDKWDTSIKIKESNRLDFIAKKVLGLPKLDYEGTLKDLYTKDYYKYLLYNCIDTLLVQQIHIKQRTFDIMLAISNLASIEMEHSVSAIRVTEGIFFKPYKEIGIVMVKQQQAGMFNQDDTEEEEDEDRGGYVKHPSAGLKSWVTVFDFASLYPTTMRQFNIGPESFKGIRINETEALLNGQINTIEENDIVLLNGAVFKNGNSETKKMITTMFSDRKKNKNIGLDHKKQVQLLKDYCTARFK